MKIAVASGKGGTGKTFVSTNLYWSLHRRGIDTTLVDCDAEEPNVAEFIPGYVLNNQIVVQEVPVIDKEQCAFCGKCFEYCNYNAIVFLPESNYIQVVESLCHDCGACYVACKHEAIIPKQKNIGTIRHMYVNLNADLFEAKSEIGVHSPVPVIKKTIKQVANESLIILDAPPGISCPFIASVVSANYVVLVTEPTPFGLNDLKLSCETLQKLDKPFGVVVNRAGIGNNDVYKWLSDNKIELLMEIKFDKEIARICSEGKLLAEQNKTYENSFVELYYKIEKHLQE
jgi:MinD superfamily P-loop ATPase